MLHIVSGGDDAALVQPVQLTACQHPEPLSMHRLCIVGTCPEIPHHLGCMCISCSHQNGIKGGVHVHQPHFLTCHSAPRQSCQLCGRQQTQTLQCSLQGYEALLPTTFIRLASRLSMLQAQGEPTVAHHDLQKFDDHLGGRPQ